MAGDVVCDCDLCPCGAPKRFKLTIAGLTGCGDHPCNECPEIDGTYILEQKEEPGQECSWEYQGGGVCTCYHVWRLHIARDADCRLVMRVYYYVKAVPWEKTDITHCWEPQYVLTGGAECFLGCQFPDSITLEPLGVYALEDTDCILGQACQKPTNIPLPEISPAFCGLDMACACAVCAGQGEHGSMGIPWPAGGAGGCGGDPARDAALNVNNGNLSVRLGQRTTQTWEHGYTTSVQQPDGNRTTYSYATLSSGLKSVESLENGAGRLTYVYDQQDLVEALVDALGRRTTNVWDEQRRLIAVENPLGERTSRTYDLSGRPEATIDPLGQRTTAVYDLVGRRIASIDPLGHRSSQTYDPRGNPLETIDPLGNIRTSVYDALSRPVATLDPLGNRTTTVYDRGGRPAATIDPLGAWSTRVYDAGNRVIATVDPLGHTNSTLYDAAGRTAATVDPLGRRTSFVHDAAGRPAATINPLGQRTTTLYDAAGRTSATVDAL
jgi:YD repeat-containing protein